MDYTRGKNNTATTEEAGGTTTISAVHPDIIQTHILMCLDGPALSSAASTCSQFHALASHEPLWDNICRATWPSTNTPRVCHVISRFPRASQSFFADSFPAAAASHSSRNGNPDRTPELISAVDIFHRRNLIMSKVAETETESGWFRCSPFRVDLLDPKDTVPTWLEYPKSEDACGNLGEELKLSWIVIDPTGTRAVNVSSRKPVSVERHWLSGEVKVRFATVIDSGEKGTATEVALCSVIVTFGKEMQVTEAYSQMEDMDGMHLNGRDSLGILQRSLWGERERLRDENEGRNRYIDFVNRKEERKEEKLKAERRLDMLCVSLAALSFAAISALYLF